MTAVPKIISGLLLLCISATSVANNLKPEKLSFDIDHSVVTKHKATINGERLNYTVSTGMQPLWDNEGNPLASLHYTYYKKDKVKDIAKRPLLISFNGGPGSASVWMHIAYTGPRVLKIDDEGYPLQPYGLKDNPYSVLDTTDIVFVNPVNTGYSRVLPNQEGKMPSKKSQQERFFGVNADIKYLAQWLNTFINRHGRALSPKFLIGESYGTTRVSGLAHELQNNQWMYLNGVILVSPTNIGIKRQGPVDVANRLPYFAATAWYHKALSTDLQNKDLLELLEEVEQYTLDKYLPALAKGAMISTAEKQAVIKNVAKYSGLSEKFVAQNNLDIPTSAFWKELLRDQELTVGRLDSRYLGIDKRSAGEKPDYWPELTSWLHSFTPAINHYFRHELNYKTDIKYNMFGPVHPWDRTNNNVGEQLRLAMAQNPYLHVMVQSGYYDGATNYFDGKYNLWHLDPSGKMKDRLSFKGYRSGHMMYLRYEDLKLSNNDLRAFIKNALPASGHAAKY
ncbi:carboxypeptidase [Pseudoalteromonas luteoviolacea S2607]|uniref:S10 family peptidase n=1 Tax=Pseudoalteromonas luteoviolacea TaxID=43657 RepID=UPI0007B042ED|nr:carboxypeptidase [Pseudoalteromonas luteoviolacea]KZN33118.1 carboxypeptidase [Pseudoalteromonas luteoviolacea S2607]